MLARLHAIAGALSIRGLLLASVLVHAAFFSYGLWQDANLSVKYTDVDYVVFSDAALLVGRGESPYARDTYRYTPLIAWMLVPVRWWASFGKLVFSAANVCHGWLLFRLLEGRFGRRAAVLSAATHLLNPIAINVCTRGNADALVGVCLLGSLLLLMQRRVAWSGALFGVLGHLRVFPVVFVPAFLAWFFAQRGRMASSALVPLAVRWAASALAAFSVVTGASWALYGDDFLWNWLLFHAQRVDHRHNFAPHFLPALLLMRDSGEAARAFLRLAASLPQAAVVLASAAAFPADLELTLFLATLAFVTFNSVVTVQYFAWFLGLAPLLLPRLRARSAALLAALAAWVGAMLLWLYAAYRLEFTGAPWLYRVWACSVLFVGASCALLVRIARSTAPSRFPLE